VQIERSADRSSPALSALERFFISFLAGTRPIIEPHTLDLFEDYENEFTF
jgi:hypothetical protein